jgi:(2Fe-2S) ferredoxin
MNQEQDREGEHDRPAAGAPESLTVVVCRGPVCDGDRGSGALTASLTASLAERGAGDRVRVCEEVCLGHCLRGPNVLVYRGDDPLDGGAVLYNRMTVEDLVRVVDRHLVGGMALRALIDRTPAR